jgi:hypothetical protein
MITEEEKKRKEKKGIDDSNPFLWAFQFSLP